MVRLVIGDDRLWRASTHDVMVKVRPSFLENRSEPGQGLFVWSYRIWISNGRPGQVTLLRRYWRITDGRGGVQEVEGEGVVGLTPVIGPGSVFEYSSAASLATPSGFMAGSYEMLSGDAERLKVEIPAFSLDSPYDVRTLN